MLYPVYVHRDEGIAFGLIFPDLPGCFAAADELAGIPQAAQEAVDAHYGRGEALPPPTSIERWAGDQRFTGGYWMTVDIDHGERAP